MPKKLVTPSDVEPVTIDEAKSHLRVTTSDDDAYLNVLISAARHHVETFTERALMPQDWDVYFDEFPTCSRYNAWGIHRHLYDPFAQQYEMGLELGLAPVQAVTSIEYVDLNGILQTLDPTVYIADVVSEPARVDLAYGKSWPGARRQRNSVIVHCECGYADSAAVPAALKLGVLLVLANFYENREPVALIAGAQPYEMPIGIQQVLSPYRINLV